MGQGFTLQGERCRFSFIALVESPVWNSNEVEFNALVPLLRVDDAPRALSPLTVFTRTTGNPALNKFSLLESKLTRYRTLASTGISCERAGTSSSKFPA